MPRHDSSYNSAMRVEKLESPVLNLAIVYRPTNSIKPEPRNARTQSKNLRLERWGVEAALGRRNFKELSDSDIQFIRGWTHDGDAVKWPRSSLDHA